MLGLDAITLDSDLADEMNGVAPCMFDARQCLVVAPEELIEAAFEQLVTTDDLPFEVVDPDELIPHGEFKLKSESEQKFVSFFFIFCQNFFYFDNYRETEKAPENEIPKENPAENSATQKSDSSDVVMIEIDNARKEETEQEITQEVEKTLNRTIDSVASEIDGLVENTPDDTAQNQEKQQVRFLVN